MRNYKYGDKALFKNPQISMVDTLVPAVKEERFRRILGIPIHANILDFMKTPA